MRFKWLFNYASSRGDWSPHFGAKKSAIHATKRQFFFGDDSLRILKQVEEHSKNAWLGREGLPIHENGEFLFVDLEALAQENK